MRRALHDSDKKEKLKMKNSKFKMDDNQQQAGYEAITERTVAFSLRVIRLYRELEPDGAGRILGRQLLRCGTSIGANLHEAQAGQSRPDFIAKMSVAHKEACETAYWLRLLRESGLVSAPRLAPLEDEAHQLGRIIATILLSTKGRRTPVSARL
jgi:four helix bundle protein